MKRATATMMLSGLVANSCGRPPELPTADAGHGSSMEVLSDFSGWWLWDFTATNDFAPVALPGPFPFKPEIAARVEQRMQELGAMFVRAVASDASSEDGARLTAVLAQNYCLPPRFIGAQASEGAMEFLFTPGRVTILDEVGLVRRIMLDQPLPAEPTESNAGTSVGHWEGQTLVVETTGFNGESQINLEKLGKGARSVERISLREPGVLEIALTLTAPEIFSEPYEHTYLFRRDADHQFVDASHCKSNDRSVDPVTRQDRFDLTPPPDLPPPPTE
jgi:hypothetical protein